jgi:hypothetical protein
VVLTSAWPSISYTVRMSAQDSSSWVAKLGRKVWQVTRLVQPSVRKAVFSPRVTAASWT